jgi:hypothetical protein
MPNIVLKHTDMVMVSYEQVYVKLRFMYDSIMETMIYAILLIRFFSKSIIFITQISCK